MLKIPLRDTLNSQTASLLKLQTNSFQWVPEVPYFSTPDENGDEGFWLNTESPNLYIGTGVEIWSDRRVL